MVMKYNLEGLIIPVFTCFENTPSGPSVDLSLSGVQETLEFNQQRTYFSNYNPEAYSLKLTTEPLPLYGNVINMKKVNGILVNDVIGEHTLMSLIERKKNIVGWSNEAKKFGLNIMVNVGGSSLPDVLELAYHAESISVDGISCLPDLFYRPRTVQELILYLKAVSKAAPKTPLLYHHNPSFTGVNLPMDEFLMEAREGISTLSGIIFSSTDMEEAVRCLNIDKDITIFIGSDQVFFEAFILGFKSAVLPTLNFWPEFFNKVLCAIGENNYAEARSQQQNINDNLNIILQGAVDPADWITRLKNYMKTHIGIPVGLSRLSVIM